MIEMRSKLLGYWLSKCNDQILKLAELVAKEQERESTVSPDDIFKSIGE